MVLKGNTIDFCECITMFIINNDKEVATVIFSKELLIDFYVRSILRTIE